MSDDERSSRGMDRVRDWYHFTSEEKAAVIEKCGYLEAQVCRSPKYEPGLASEKVRGIWVLANCHRSGTSYYGPWHPKRTVYPVDSAERPKNSIGYVVNPSSFFYDAFSVFLKEDPDVSHPEAPILLRVGKVQAEYLQVSYALFSPGDAQKIVPTLLDRDDVVELKSQAGDGYNITRVWADEYLRIELREVGLKDAGGYYEASRYCVFAVDMEKNKVMVNVCLVPGAKPTYANRFVGPYRLDLEGITMDCISRPFRKLRVTAEHVPILPSVSPQSEH